MTEVPKPKTPQRKIDPEIENLESLKRHRDVLYPDLSDADLKSILNDLKLSPIDNQTNTDTHTPPSDDSTNIYSLGLDERIRLRRLANLD